MTVRLLTIAAPDGNVMAFRLPELTADDRAIIAQAWAEHFGDLTPQQERQILLMLAEDVFEERIYEKVAERRGVLAL